MCLTPLTIKNPYYRLGNKGLNCLHNTHDSHIRVPCGSCVQCISQRQGWLNQRVQMESLRSHLFFFTLTYQDSSLAYTDVSDYKIAYPLYSDVQNLFKRLRKLGFKFRYWVVSEYGTKSFRPHFHGLLALDKSIYTESVINLESRLFNLILFNWKRNISKDTFNPIYIDLCRFVCKGGHRTFDLHYVEPIKDHDNDTSFYMSKYICKYDSRIVKLLQKITLDNSLSHDDTTMLLSQLKPRSFMSKDFGSYKYQPIKDYILNNLVYNDMIPQFVDLNTGRMSMLSPYYRRHLVPSSYTYNKYLKYSISPDSMDIPDDSTVYDYLINVDKLINNEAHFAKIKKHIANRCI